MWIRIHYIIEDRTERMSHLRHPVITGLLCVHL